MANDAIAFVPPVQVNTGLLGMSGVLQVSLESFRAELYTLIRDYADPNKPLIIGDMYFSPTEKYEQAGAAALSLRLSEIESTETELMQIYQILPTLERSLAPTGGTV